MININRIITPDYENSGSLYTLEVTTDSEQDYQEALAELLKLQEKQRNRYKRQKEDKNE